MKPYGESYLRRVYGQYKFRARSKKREFELDFDVFVDLISLDCYYCGARPKVRETRAKRPQHGRVAVNGLDRLKPQIGYTQANVVPSCPTCNYMKHTLGLNCFVKQVGKIHANLNKKVKRSR